MEHFDTSPAAGGFTLVELMTLLAIVSIITVSGIPWLDELILRSRLTGTTSSLFAGLNLTRNHALTQNRRYTLCGSDNGKQCQKIWHKELILFEDRNSNHEPEPDEIIYQIPVHAKGLEIQTRVGFGKPYAKFSQRGYAGLSGSFLLCSQEEPVILYRKITWNVQGRPYVLSTPQQINKHSSIDCWQ